MCILLWFFQTRNGMSHFRYTCTNERGGEREREVGTYSGQDIIIVKQCVHYTHHGCLVRPSTFNLLAEGLIILLVLCVYVRRLHMVGGVLLCEHFGCYMTMSIGVLCMGDPILWRPVCFLFSCVLRERHIHI